MPNGELAKMYQFHLYHEKNVQQNQVWFICKENVSLLDENIAALWVWLNSSKSDDLRTNVFSTSTKCKSQGKKYLLDLQFFLLLMLLRSICHQVSNQTNRWISSSGDDILLSANISPTDSSGLLQGNGQSPTYSWQWAILQGNGQSPTYSSGLLQGKHIFWICWSPLSRHYKKLG